MQIFHQIMQFLIACVIDSRSGDFLVINSMNKLPEKVWEYGIVPRVNVLVPMPRLLALVGSLFL